MAYLFRTQKVRKTFPTSSEIVSSIRAMADLDRVETLLDVFGPVTKEYEMSKNESLELSPIFVMYEICLSSNLPNKPRTELHNLNLALLPGEITGVVCNSPEEAHALCSLATGFTKPDSGHIKLDTIGDYHEHYPNNMLGEISFIFDHPLLVPSLTIIENIELAIAGKSSDKKMKTSQEMLRVLGSIDCLSNYPDQLAIDEQFAVSLARALVKKPKLLVLQDLSCFNEKTLYRLKRLIRHTGTTVLTCMDKVLHPDIIDRTLYIHNGTLVPR